MSTSGYISEEIQNTILKYMYPYGHYSAIYNSQHMEATQVTISRQMNKKVVVYIYMHTHTHTHTLEYYSVIQKTKILPFATAWMDLEGIMLSE